MLRKGGMRGLASTRAMKFEWQKLVTPMTPKTVVAKYQSMEADISRNNQAASSISRNVEPIDWAYWKKQITSPGVVEELQKEYESMNFPKVNPYNEENNAKLAKIDADIVLAKKEAVHASKEVLEAEKAIATAQKVKTEGMDWGRKQWSEFMPGLDEQYKEEYENEDYIVSDEKMKFDSVNWSDARENYLAGESVELPKAEERVGDMYLSEETKLAEEGTWSIARAFASKEERSKIQERVEKYMAAVN